MCLSVCVSACVGVRYVCMCRVCVSVSVGYVSAWVCMYVRVGYMSMCVEGINMCMSGVSVCDKEFVL